MLYHHKFNHAPNGSNKKDPTHKENCKVSVTIPLALFFSAKYDRGPKEYLEETGYFEQMPFFKCYLLKCTYLAGQMNIMGRHMPNSDLRKLPS